MNLKYLLTGCLAFVLLSFSIIPACAHTTGGDDEEKIIIKDLKTDADIEAARMLLASRVEKLRAAKKTALTKMEKKALRGEIKEVRNGIKAVNEVAKRISGGIYLGTGALLAIILLLLLL